MRQILLLLLLVPQLSWGQDVESPVFNPDFDGDGCHFTNDLLELLCLFGTCETETMEAAPGFYPYFMEDSCYSAFDLLPFLALFGTCEGASQCASPTLDGHTYSVAQIGDQCWFAENLRTTTYADGMDIPAGLTEGEWTTTTSGATAVYGEDDECDNYSPDIDACDEAQSLEEYGRLYNWYAVDDARGLCPSGWHVPTDGEWTDLEDFITSQGFDGTEATSLKSIDGWYNGGNGTDDSGFSLLPGGRRDIDGNLGNAGSDGYWWSSSPSGDSAWTRYLSYSIASIYRNSANPRFGFSVRCLKDAE